MLLTHQASDNQEQKLAWLYNVNKYSVQFSSVIQWYDSFIQRYEDQSLLFLDVKVDELSMINEGKKSLGPNSDFSQGACSNGASLLRR